MKWYKTHAFTALWQASVILILAWLLVGLNTNLWDWKTGLLVPLISNLIVCLKEMWSPSVAGPFAFMNRSNPG